MIEGLLLTQCAYSIVTLITCFMVVHRWHPETGVLIGFVMQFFWIHLWWLTHQYGVIIMDLGILYIYTARILKYEGHFSIRSRKKYY